MLLTTSKNMKNMNMTEKIVTKLKKKSLVLTDLSRTIMNL